MHLNGNFELTAVQENVYDFLTDYDRLTTIIPDVLSYEKVDEKNAKLLVKAGVSFIKGKFNLKLEIKEAEKPSRMVLYGIGQGSGSSVNFTAVYALHPLSNSSSNVVYDVEINITGTAATVGSRMIQRSAEKYVNKLIESFKGAFDPEKA